MAPPEIAPVVRGFKYIGSGYVNGELYDLGDFPGARLDDGEQGKVYGKIYEIPDVERVFDALDQYEEFDPRTPNKSLFIRKRTLVNRSNRKPIEAWIYEYNRKPNPSKKIKSGQYSKVAA
jgi:gamma-glutamylcyclotransferase (GGCT)/AIG2-like uncharacterized protein YtfP